MKKKLLFFGLILGCCFMFLSVYAATNIGGTVGVVEKNFCIPAGTTILKDDGTNVDASGAYHIKYTSEVATMVDYKTITFTDIINGHVPYPTGTTESDLVQYQFDSEYYSNNCYVDSNGDVQTCPTSSQISKYDIYAKFNDTNYSNYVTFVLNESTGKFDIFIEDIFNDELYVRYVVPGNALNADGKKTASDYMGGFLTREIITVNGKKFNGYKVSNVTGSGNGKTAFFNLEFYIKKGSSCINVYLGSVGIELPNANDYDIVNPALANPGYYGCSDVKNYVPTGMTKREQDESLTPLKQSYISECYVQKIAYSEKNNLKNTINQKFEKLKAMFNSYTSSNSTSSLKCEESHTQSKLSYSYSGTYWMMTCFENYTAQGDTAKLVKAGNGFEYQTQYSVTRTCNISQINRPSKPAKCNYDCGHVCYWNESTGVKSGTDGGPSDDFDACVLQCDNGTYTQSCINSCYNQVYQSNRDLSFTDKFSFDTNNKSTTTRLSSCTTNHNRPGEAATGGCGETYCVSDFCNNHGGYCVSWSNVYPSGCVDNPEEVYGSALEASKNELAKLKVIQEETIDTGDYTYQIADSHLVTKNGTNYIYSINSSNDPALNVDSKESVVSVDTVSTPLGNNGGANISYNSSYVKRSDITVHLPLSYVNRVTGSIVYKTSETSNRAFYVDHEKNMLSTFPNFDARNYYDPQHKYFTSIWSENLNVVVNCNTGKAELFRQGDYNIKVTSSNVGAGDFSSDIQCYYGVYNNYYKSDEHWDETCIPIPPCPDCPIDPPSEPIPTPEDVSTTGIQYIYRPIDLENVFPNRDPRWNWKGTLNKSNNTFTEASRFASETNLNYDIDPEATTKNIESKGYSIYDVLADSSEIDYEFVLTTENIRNIRKYNKSVRDYNGDGNNNYLDYNMSCYINSKGREVCTSRFLDNIDGNSGGESYSDFITYSVNGYGIDARKSIAGCNNAIGGTECDD